MSSDAPSNRSRAELSAADRQLALLLWRAGDWLDVMHELHRNLAKWRRLGWLQPQRDMGGKN